MGLILLLKKLRSGLSHIAVASMKNVISILIGLALIIVILPLILVYVNTHPPRYPIHIAPSAYQADYDEVSFTREDGITLKGWPVKPTTEERIGDFFDRSLR